LSYRLRRRKKKKKEKKEEKVVGPGGLLALEKR
jgi:hypothetical protein